MVKKILTLTAAISLLVFQSAGLMAQKKTRTVTGTVKDSNGEPLAGAVVVVKGTAVGSIVDDDGSFSLQVGKNAVVEASMLGYVTSSRTVGEEKVINFVLKDDAEMLEEAVVEVGYGEQRLVDLTGTVSRVNIDELAKTPILSIGQALQGRVAGMSITSSDGQPGNEMDVVIRGNNSLTQSNSPLYVVDGFPMEDFSSSSLSPEDVASVTVLKDASSTAIYGSRAANGVIIIETKKGRLGKPQISYSGTVQLHQASKRMEMMNPYDYVVYQIERSPSNFDKYLTNVGRTMDYYLNDYNAIDWQDRLFRNAIAHTHNLSLMGGTKQTRYSVSGSVVDQQGVIVNSGYQKYQGRASLEQKINNHLTFNLNATYTHSVVSGQTSSASLSSSNSYATYLMYRTWAYRPVSLTSDSEEALFEDDDTSSAAVMNPVISNLNEQSTKKTTNFVANAKVDWTFANYWKLSVRGGYNMKLNRSEEFNNSKTVKGFPRVTNTLGINGSFSESRADSWMNEDILSYDRTFGKKHKLGVMAGFSVSGVRTSVYGFTAAQVPDESMGLSGMDNGIPQSVKASFTGNTLMSAFGRVNYSYDSRYLFTATFRADGSSKFAKGHKWGYFPSAAFAWRFSQEKWGKSAKWLDDGKLRLTYGSTGNNRVSDYASFATLVMNDYYPVDGNPQSAIVQSAMGNRDITWETTDQYDVGLDLRMFDSRLGITVDYYNKVTRNLLLNSNVPYSSGFTSVYKNVGKISNQGVEITLTATPVRTRNFIWTSEFNISFNKDRVLELAENQESLLSKVSFTGDFNGTYLYIAQVGGPVASFYGMLWDGCYTLDDFDYNAASGKYVLKDGVPSNGDARETIQPGDIKYVDINEDGIVNDQDMTVIGRCAPIHTGGFNNTFTWKDLSLNIFLTWSYGNQIMNANRIFFEGNYSNKNINQFASYNDHWTIDNQNSRNFRPGGQGPRGVYSDRTIEDGSFLRLSNLQLSYSLPKRVVSKMKIEGLRLSLTGQNLWTISKYSGLDPEVSTRHSALTPGFDYSAYARNRVFTFGLNITF